MEKRNFAEWLKTFRPSINSYDYYTDFAKVHENAARLKLEINILNALVGSKNIEADFEKILTRYPECLQAIPILLAVREREIFLSRYKLSFRRAQAICRAIQIFHAAHGTV